MVQEASITITINICLETFLLRGYNYNFMNYSSANYLRTVGTKIIADPEKCFQELISDKLLIFLRDGPCLELIVVSSNFQALLLLQDKLLESV